MTLLQKSYRGVAVLFDLNSDLLLYVGTIVLALAGAGYMAQLFY
ncbi:hypothetical protein SAMN06297129_2227 [Pseudooceanicola antarcticus]|uniref:Uncharacterized protein n=1 Tax=Pseudooceanicola antarcticus TaxID=1247613 RepID=A0A285IX13_9RHOB|nr:hypothetical protein [Pseudooceanicola antarcticus]SNY52217.1 hypothetical protein SAMN06297129_2227 [Pseudooceanicola antarcticus]